MNLKIISTDSSYKTDENNKVFSKDLNNPQFSSQGATFKNIFANNKDAFSTIRTTIVNNTNINTTASIHIRED